MSEAIDRRRLVGFLGAISLFLAAIEYLFPKPVPFFRLGISNLPLLVALEVLSLREVLVLVGIKVLGQGLVNGTLLSYVFFFSLAGSMASALVMLVARGVNRFWLKAGVGHKPVFSLMGISLWGALGSNVVQIALSLFFVFGTSAWAIAPLFMALGTGAGLGVGWAAQAFTDKSRWWKGVMNGL